MKKVLWAAGLLVMVLWAACSVRNDEPAVDSGSGSDTPGEGGAAVVPDSPASDTSPRATFSQAREAYFSVVRGGSDARLSEATAGFRRVVEAEPQNEVARAYLGSSLLLASKTTGDLGRKEALAREGLELLDRAVNADGAPLEARFIRSATTATLPFWFGRGRQSRDDLAYVAARAEAAAAADRLPPDIAAAALQRYGDVMKAAGDSAEARRLWQAAVRIAPQSPAGELAAESLKDIR